jgi:imidazolonepropionase-like amidohydrolase
MRYLTTTVLALMMFVPQVQAQQHEIPSEVILFKNVKVFNGTEAKLHDVDVLVVGNKIHKVEKDIPTSGTYDVDVKSKKVTYSPYRGASSYSLNITDADGEKQTKKVKVHVVDGSGRTLMPGLIDSHVHLTHMLVPGGLEGWEAATWEELGGMSAAAAREFLMSGFTTVRDMGGMGTGFKRVIDRGDLAGPRIYSAGAYISQTSGHGDLRLRSQVNVKSNLETLRLIRRADGVPEMTKAVRENFAEGAAYIKIMVGGGVTSAKDPLHTLQFTPAEIRAAVENAANWDSYVAVHVYQAAHVKRALELGIKCIDHGHFIDKEAMELLVSRGAFLSTNFPAFSDEALKHPVYGNPKGPQYPKMIQFLSEKDPFLKLAKQYKPRMVFNTDIVLSNLATTRAMRDNAMYLHAEFMGNFEALKAMTSTGGELAALTGKNNPYPGKLGVIEPGAYADLILVDGNPLEDITVIGVTDNLRIIIKDGKVYKNTL